MTSVTEFHRRFPTDEACLEHLFVQRFGTHPPCLDCGQPAQWYRLRTVRQFGTNCCRARHIAPQAGTLFAGTALPLRLWFYAMLLFANDRTGLSSSFLAHHLGITQRSAWRVANAIRLHMTALEAGRMLGGPGMPVRIGTTLLRRVRTHGVRGRGRLLLLVAADARHGRTWSYLARNRPRLWNTLLETLLPGSTVVTDDVAIHAWLADRLARLEVSRRFALRFETSSWAANPLAGHVVGLKSWLRAAHLHLNRASAERYIGEFEFRRNRRDQPHRAFDDMIAAFPAVSMPKQRHAERA